MATEGGRHRRVGGLTLFIQSFRRFSARRSTGGAVAVIGGQGGHKASGMNLTHTGILGFDADFALPVVDR